MNGKINFPNELFYTEIVYLHQFGEKELAAVGTP